MEQLEIPWARAAVLTMSGQVTIGGEGDAQLLGCVEDLLAGKYTVLVGHPESFQTAEGQKKRTFFPAFKAPGTGHVDRVKV